MFAFTLALAAAAPTVIDAERAFAQMAQEKGQWTAFRAYAAPDAVMFTPQPVNAQEFLRDKKDPPKAIRWQPTHAWVSCDGTLAVDTGNWQSADGKAVGYFTTVWQRQTDGSWKWIYDGGDGLVQARPQSEPILQTVACKPGKTIELVGRSPESAGMTSFGGISEDGTLQYLALVKEDGERWFTATSVMSGRVVIDDHVAASPK
jgi:hypothetical protein